MLITSSSAFMSHRSDANPPSSIVPPAQLFTIAGSRFIHAFRDLEVGDGTSLPDAKSAELAIVQAESGVRILGSTLVPTTPIGQRRQATAAIESAKQAIASLQLYQAFVSADGSNSEGGSVPRDEVPREAVRFLLAGQDLLIDALAALA